MVWESNRVQLQVGGGVIGWSWVINTECSKKWNLALPFFSSAILSALHRSLLQAPAALFISAVTPLL